MEALSSLTHWRGAGGGGSSQCKKDPLIIPGAGLTDHHRSGCLEPCELNLAVHNPHPQETPFQNTAEAESKATSVLRQVICRRHHLLCSQVLTGPEKLRVPEMGLASLVTGGESFPTCTPPRPLPPKGMLDDLADRVRLPGGEWTVHPSQKNQEVQRYRT